MSELMNKQIRLKLHRDINEVLTPWQIQEFIAKLASTYYKLDLINEMSKKINNGIDAENIFIMDISFNSNTLYSFLNKSSELDLKKTNEFKNFYHFGKPISIIPNDEILKINLKFELFSELNTYLNKKNINNISKEDFQNVIFNKDPEFKEVRNLIKFKEDTERELKKRYQDDIRDIINQFKLKLKKINNDLDSIDILKKSIKNNAFKEEDEEKDIFNIYFKRFQYLFMRLERPVIGIYNSSEKKVEILSSSFIMRKSRDHRFLDIKQISHNSPTFVDIAIGLVFALPLAAIVANVAIQNIKSTKKEKKIGYDSNIVEIREMLEKTKKEVESSTQEILNIKQIKEIDVIDKITKEYSLNEYENIKNKYVKKSVKNLFKDVNKKAIENLESYDFTNENLELDIIEFVRE